MEGTKTGRMRTASFASAIARVKKELGPNYKGVISQSFLRAEEYLTDGEGNYTFNFRAAKNGQPTERLLKENDAFVALGYSLTLAVKDSTTPSAFVKQYYVNKFVFETETGLAAPGTFIADHLEAIFNAGSLSYQKGDTTYLPALPLSQNRFVGQTQQTTANNATSTEHNGNGVVSLARSIKMQGIDVGDWGMFIPSANALKLQYTTGATGHATKKVVAILELHGILVSGGAKILTAASKPASAE